MNIAVATLSSPECFPLHDITAPEKRAYCERHGYKFEVKSGDFKIVDHCCGWHKYVFERWRWLAELLKGYDAVFFCGTDVLITNQTIRLEDLMEGRKPFIISQDAQMPNSDVMLVRNNPRAIELIELVAASHERHCNSAYLDQTAFQELMPTFEDVIEILPQRLMNAYDYGMMGFWYAVHDNYRLAIDKDGNDGQWKPGDFIFHCPGIPYDQRAAAIRSRICLTIR